MTLFAGLVAAAAALAALTWAHLRPSARGAAVAVPSLQHLSGAAPLRSRRIPLEEPLAWALRGAALLCAVLALCGAVAGWEDARAPVIAVDPAEGEAGLAWARARGAAAILSYDPAAPAGAERPTAEGPLGDLALARLRACSGPRPACLVRAGVSLGLPLLLRGPLAGGFAEALRAEAAGVVYFSLSNSVTRPLPAQPAVARPRPAPPAITARGPLARLAAAALEGEPLPGPLLITEGAAEADLPAPSGTFALRLFTEPAPASQRWPALGPVPPRDPAGGAGDSGVLLTDPADLAAGVAGLGLGASLAFAPRADSAPVAGQVAVRRVATAEAAIAATAEEWGRWSHAGLLAPLLRATLASLGGAVRVEEPPPGGERPWREETTGAAALVGLADVAPGRYLRDPGVRLDLARGVEATGGPLSADALAALGLLPDPGAPAGPGSVTALLAAALLCWLAAAAFAPRRPLALPLWLAAAALLSLLLADVRWLRPRTRPLTLATTTPLAPFADLPLLPLTPGATAPACASAFAAEACALLFTLAPAGAEEERATALLFDGASPRADLVSVRSPARLPVGASAALEVTVRLRRAAGQTALVRARLDDAPAAEVQLRAGSADELRTVSLTLSPLLPGAHTAAVEVEVRGTPAGADGGLVRFEVEPRKTRRLLLAPYPSWEVRAAARALAAEETGEAASAVAVGKTALLVRGAKAGAASPLSFPKALEGFDTVVLSGFTPAQLQGAPAAALRALLTRGGAVVVLGGAAAAQALGWPVQETGAASPQPLQGTLGEDPRPLSFTGVLPSAVRLPEGAAVLARLSPAGRAETLPWMVGRSEGQGRLVAVTVPELQRLSPPAGEGEATVRALLHAVAWAEAARAGPASLDRETTPEEATARLLPVRARLRAQAHARHLPFVEFDSPAELRTALARLPNPEAHAEPRPLRREALALFALCLLVAAEALVRRRSGAGAVGR